MVSKVERSILPVSYRIAIERLYPILGGSNITEEQATKYRDVFAVTVVAGEAQGARDVVEWERKRFINAIRLI